MIPASSVLPGCPETPRLGVYGDDGLFGTIARISSTYVFVFIVFGAFLVRRERVNLHRFGRDRGPHSRQPRFVAVISSD